MAVYKGHTQCIRRPRTSLDIPSNNAARHESSRERHMLRNSNHRGCRPGLNCTAVHNKSHGSSPEETLDGNGAWGHTQECPQPSLGIPVRQGDAFLLVLRRAGRSMCPISAATQVEVAETGTQPTPHTLCKYPSCDLYSTLPHTYTTAKQAHARSMTDNKGSKMTIITTQRRSMCQHAYATWLTGWGSICCGNTVPNTSYTVRQAPV